MSENILITGGAGFIGSHLSDALIEMGHRVTVLDILHPQVHGPRQEIPAYLNKEVNFILGDVRDIDAMRMAIEGKTIIFHFAAYTGVGQSMYEIRDYLDVNVQGSGVLFELLSQRAHQVKKVIVASSRAVYGEGAYLCANCGLVRPNSRTPDQLDAGQWEPVCPICRSTIQPLPTPETLTPDPQSIYAITKLNQEQIAVLLGQAYHLPVVVLRFFNVFGPRQALGNPYTGVIGTFLSRLKGGNPPRIYEDGQESRDFVHVSDVVRACLLSMSRKEADGEVINVGSGEQISLFQVARTISEAMKGPGPIVTGQFRVGDIRHCHADLSKAKVILGYEPRISFETGIRDLVAQLTGLEWEDRSIAAEKELADRGLASSKAHARR